MWPASACVEQLLACALRKIVDGALDDAILEVGIDASEGELLLASWQACLKALFFLEVPVVAVVVEDLHVVFSGKCLEGTFGG